MIVFKVFVYAMALFGLSFVFSVIVGKMIAYGYRRAYKPPAVKPRMTVVWRDTDVMQCAYTGYIEPLGKTHIKITDDSGWPVVVDRRDILEVY